MNNHYLLNFGDSWAHGADAGVNNAYAKLIAEQLNLEFLDYSIPSSSAPRMITQLQQFLESRYDPNNQYTALFFITAQERQLLFRENGEPREMHVQEEGTYFGMFYANRLGNFSLNTTIITLQAMCSKYNINDHYILGWQYPALWPEVDKNKFYDNGNTNAMNIINGDNVRKRFDQVELTNHPGYTNGHPSIVGHRQIAQAWLKYIKHNLSPDQ